MDQDAWVALAAERRSDDLDVLLDALFNGTMRDVGARLLLLAEREPDVRIARALTAAVMKPPFTSTSSQRVVWTPLFALLTRLGDAETLARLTPLAEGYARQVGGAAAGKSMQAKLRRLLAALEKRHGAPLAHEPAAPPPEAHDASPEALFAAILAAPDDDTPREVLADVLLQRGDPRGEFIALELRRSRGEHADERRAAELLAAHKRAWLEPIAKIVDVDGAVFARGFLDVVRVNGHPAAKVAATAGHPIWGTVRELRCRHPRPKPLAVIMDPVMGALRKVTDLDPKAFFALADSTRPLPITDVEVLWLEDIRGRKNLIRSLSDARGLPALERLYVAQIHEAPESYAFFWEGRLAQRLDSFAIDVIDVAGWIDEILARKLTRPRRVVLSRIYELTSSQPGGVLDQLTVHPAGERDVQVPTRIVRILEQVPPGLIARLSVAPAITDPELSARYQAALQRHAAAKMLSPSGHAG